MFVNQQTDYDYGWIIDEQHIGVESRDGVVGPSDIPEEIEKQLEDGEGKTFRMLDADDNVYYKGRIIKDEGDGKGFEPLDDFGRPDAGAIYIEYLNNGSWERL
jgi:hypothetical protein